MVLVPSCGLVIYNYTCIILLYSKLIIKTKCIVQDEKEPLFGPAAFVVCIHRCDVAVLKVMIVLDVLLTGPSDSAAIYLQKQKGCFDPA